MGLLDFFGKRPLSEAKIAKIAKLAANPYAQSDVRMREMERLLIDGSPAALGGVLKRFAANANGHIADEDEKKWLENQLVNMGRDAVEPLRSFIRNEDKLTYALRAYRRLNGPEEAVRFFIEVLEHYGPEDYRSGEAKLQVVWQLAENIEDARVLPALIPFLRDHSDDIAWAVMDLLEKGLTKNLVNDELRRAAATSFGEMVIESSIGPRIQRRAAEFLCAHEWPIESDATELATFLDEEYFLDKKKFVRRRARARG